MCITEREVESNSKLLLLFTCIIPLNIKRKKRYRNSKMTFSKRRLEVAMVKRPIEIAFESPLTPNSFAQSYHLSISFKKKGATAPTIGGFGKDHSLMPLCRGCFCVLNP